MAPRVSVVVPTRDRAGELPGALASVVAQSLEDWECIVVDDGSSDGTTELMANRALAEPRLRVVRREGPGSAAAARNAGIAAARAELVAFLDDDDRWLPGKLESQIRLLDADPRAAFVCGRVERFGDADGTWPARAASDRPSIRRLLAGNFVPTSTVVVRRDALQRAGGFDETFRVAEDYDLWIRIALQSAFRADPAVVARHRFDAARHAGRLAFEIEALESIASRLSASGAVPPAWLRPVRRRIHRYRARHGSSRRERLTERLRAIF